MRGWPHSVKRCRTVDSRVRVDLGSGEAIETEGDDVPTSASDGWRLIGRQMRAQWRGLAAGVGAIKSGRAPARRAS